MATAAEVADRTQHAGIEDDQIQAPDVGEEPRERWPDGRVTAEVERGEAPALSALQVLR